MADKQEELHYDIEELAEYFAGDMPDDEAAPLEAHLGKCPHCRTEALRIGERSAAWFSWSPEAHRAEAAAGVAPASRRGIRVYLWPSVAVAGVAASLILILVNVQRGHLIEQVSQRLIIANQATASATERTRQLEREVADLRGRITQRPQGPTGPITPKGQGPVETPVTIADARPAVSLEAGSLGATAAKSQTVTVSGAIPSVRVRITLPELSENAIVDAAITEGDWRTEERSLAIQSEGGTRFVVLLLNQEEVRRLLNRPALMTLTNRGRATIGTVILTIRLQ